MGEHTPGPWQIEGKFQKAGSAKWGFIISAGINAQHDGPAAYVGDLLVTEANARLIAAAPELLSFLRWAVGMAEEAIVAREAGDDPEDTPTVVQMHRAELAAALSAIARAEGR